MVSGVERGRMLLISGPSGSGKSTICKRLLEDPRVEFSVSATTRPMRPGEVDGRDYRFLSAEKFSEHVENGDFIEFAEGQADSEPQRSCGEHQRDFAHPPHRA